MKHYRRSLILLAILSVATFGMAQTSFDPEYGCLNVIDVSYAQGIGEYGDGGISANYQHEKFINERFCIGAGIGYNHHKKYKFSFGVQCRSNFPDKRLVKNFTRFKKIKLKRNEQ